MDNKEYFEDIFKSIHDYKKTVLFINLIQNDKNLLKEIGFSKNDINQLNLEFKDVLIEQNEDFLSYIKNQEESIIEEFWISKWKLLSILYLKMLDMNEVLFYC